MKPTYEELLTQLGNNQSAWEDEEDSVKEEHAELIAANEAMLKAATQPLSREERNPYK